MGVDCLEAVETGGYHQTAEMKSCGPQALSFLSPLTAEGVARISHLVKKDLALFMFSIC